MGEWRKCFALGKSWNFFSNFVLKILSELCSNFFDGFVLGFRDFEPNVANKEDLQNDENNENVGSNRQLKKSKNELKLE